MLAKAAFGLVIVIASLSGSLAASRSCPAGSSPTIYNPNGASIGTDPDQGIAFESNRDRDRAHSN
jgi:hypothetical protein